MNLNISQRKVYRPKIVFTYQESTVDVSEQVFVGPFKAVRIVLLAIIGTADIVFPVCPPESINDRNWTPMLEKVLAWISSLF